MINESKVEEVFNDVKEVQVGRRFDKKLIRLKVKWLNLDLKDLNHYIN